MDSTQYREVMDEATEAYGKSWEFRDGVLRKGRQFYPSQVMNMADNLANSMCRLTELYAVCEEADRTWVSDRKMTNLLELRKLIQESLIKAQSR